MEVIERIVRKEVLSIPKWTSLNITNSLIINVCISESMLGPRKQNRFLETKFYLEFYTDFTVNTPESTLSTRTSTILQGRYR